MIEIFEPWHLAFRRLLLHAPAGSETPKTPISVPDDLRPPKGVPHEENGFAKLYAHLNNWPAERDYPVDFRHRIERLPEERKVAERALVPYRPLLEELDPILATPTWQAVIPDGQPSISLRQAKRLGYALALSGVLDPQNGDHERAISIGQRLRRCEAGIAGLLAGIAVENTAEGSLQELAEDRYEAVRTELSRLVFPNLTSIGPWDPLPWPWTGVWEDRRRVQQWLLSGHSKPYDPQATADALVAQRGLMANGSAEDIRLKAVEIAGPWPDQLRPESGWSHHPVPMSQVRRAKADVQAMENPYGALMVARSMLWAAGAAEWVERLSMPRLADADAPPAPAEAS